MGRQRARRIRQPRTSIADQHCIVRTAIVFRSIWVYSGATYSWCFQRSTILTSAAIRCKKISFWVFFYNLPTSANIYTVHCRYHPIFGANISHWPLSRILGSISLILQNSHNCDRFLSYQRVPQLKRRSNLMSTLAGRLWGFVAWAWSTLLASPLSCSDLSADKPLNL